MIPPDAGVGDVHCLFALAGGRNQGAIGIEDSLVEKAAGLLLPDTQANVVIDVLQAINVVPVEAAAKVRPPSVGSGTRRAPSASR